MKSQRMIKGTNAPVRPEHEGEIVRFKSPHSSAILYDIARKNQKYGFLEWNALNEPTPEQIKQAREI
jgi:hypothetical protein